MGSLISQPSAPARPDPVIVRVPVATPPPASQPVSSPVSNPAVPTGQSAPSESEAATPQESEQAASEQRSTNLLGRERGRFGTILTGFRGVLAPANREGSPVRKTLLGE